MIQKWKYCALSQEALIEPIVACELGRLYNKDKLIEFLLDRTQFEAADNFKHIRGLKDVKEIKLTDNPAQNSKQVKNEDAYLHKQTSQYICPVSGLEMSGKYKFCYFLKCGCVFSERALKEIKTDICQKCGLEVGENNVITINPSEADLETAKANLQHRRLQAKLSKKSKKHKIVDTECEKDVASSSKMAKTDDSESESTKKDTESATKIVARGRRDFKSSVKSGQSTKGSSAVKTKTIQEDPSASKAYKALFNTCDKAKNQQTPNWVTYNPCFY